MMRADAAFASADAAVQSARQSRASTIESLEREREWANFVVGVIPRCTHMLRSPRPTPQSNLRATQARARSKT